MVFGHDSREPSLTKGKSAPDHDDHRKVDEREAGMPFGRMGRRADFAAIVFAILFPSAVTWAYFVALADSPAGWQTTVAGAGKALQFAWPLLWTALIAGQAIGPKRPSGEGCGLGAGFGLLVAAAMAVLYFGWLRPAGFFAGPAELVRDKVAGMNLASLPRYAALGIFYSLVHSLLEEYYWRWFVFGRLRRHVHYGAAIGVSAIGFMAHHVIVLATYFGALSPATWLFSAAVAIGGAVWAWMYHRSGSLYGPWLSHLIVDAAIFAIGYDLIRATL